MNRYELPAAVSAPVPVQWARALLAVIALSHLVVPVVLWIDPAPLRGQVAISHREFDPATIDRSVGSALIGAAAFHVLLLGLAVLLIWRLPTGRAWTRRLTTISALLSILFSVVSWSSSPQFHAVIPLLDAVQAAIVLLMWAPYSARDFFTAPNSQTS